MCMYAYICVFSATRCLLTSYTAVIQCAFSIPLLYTGTIAIQIDSSLQLHYYCFYLTMG